METGTSADGTSIAFERSGDGPPLVLVHGATADHTTWVQALPFLKEQFTVYAMGRRGRGESGDADEYTLDQEAEDVAAVVDPLSAFLASVARWGVYSPFADSHSRYWAIRHRSIL